jgi:hypothetical protein
MDDHQVVDMQRKRNLRKAAGALIVTLGLTGCALGYVVVRNLLGRETLWLLPMLLVGLRVSYSYWMAGHTGAPGPEQDLERKGGYRITLAGLLALAVALGCFYGAASMIARRLSDLDGVAVAVATVVSTGNRISGRYSIPWAKVRFSLPDGRIVEATLNHTELSVGTGQKTVKIRYKIRDPRKAVADCDPLLYLMVAVFCALGVVFIMAAYFASRPLPRALPGKPVPGSDALDRAGNRGKPDATGAAIDMAGVDQAPGMTGRTGHALGWTVAIAVLAVAAFLAASAERTAPGSPWLTSAQFQREFDTLAPQGFYPGEVEGQCQTDGEKYRADWKAIPSGAYFFAYYGMTLPSYELKDQEYRSQGYSLESAKHFKDCSGIERYQATWLKR